jgi:sugar phosphate isomerase/epimerase
MERALSTHLFVEHRLTTVWLDRAWKAGIPLVEIYCGRQHLDYRNKAQIAELRHWFRDADMKLHSLHSPQFSDDVWGRSGPNAIVNIAELEKGRRIRAVDEVKHAIEIAESVPFRYLVQHIGVEGEEFEPRKIDSTFSSLEELAVFARHRGVEVLIENTPNELATAERLLTFFETTHMDLNVCFDVGHAHMRGSVEGEFRLLKPRIRSTHVHDNDGKHDLHLFPMSDGAGGTVDWHATMALLRSAPGQYPLLLEPRSPENMAQPIEEAMKTFGRLEGLRTAHES